MKYCKKCGTQMDDSADFCPQCGTKASAPKNGNNTNAQTANAAPEREQPKTEPPKQEQTPPRQADNSPLETRSYESKTAEKKKLPLPALIAIIGGAAAAVIIAVVVNLPKNTGETLPQISATVASAEPTMPPEPSLTAQPSEEPSADFTLTQQQATELLTDVAAPLLLTEWNAVMTYPDTYNPEDWQNLPHVNISDFDGMITHGDVDTGNDYWVEFYNALGDVDDTARYAGASDGTIFGNSSYWDSGYNITIEIDAFKQYFEDAFGSSVPYRLTPQYSGYTGDEEFDLTVQASDPYADIEITDLPNGPVDVIDGKVTFTGNICGMFVWDWQPWNMGPDDVIPWTITLDVVENPDSRFGCNVTGYQASAVVNDTAQADLSLNGVWISEDATLVIDGVHVEFYTRGDIYADEIFNSDIKSAGYGDGEYNSDGSLSVQTLYKDRILENYLITPINAQSVEVTYLGEEGVESTPYSTIYYKAEGVTAPAPHTTASINLDGTWVYGSDNDYTALTVNGDTFTYAISTDSMGNGGKVFPDTTGYYDENGAFIASGDWKGAILTFTMVPIDENTVQVETVVDDYTFDAINTYNEIYMRVGSTSSSSATAPATFNADGLLFPDSNTRYLTAEELAPLDKEMLGYARNEIFARHGNIFETPKYRDWYSQFSWYNNLPKVADVGYPDLNEYEIANVELIKQFEAAAA